MSAQPLTSPGSALVATAEPCKGRMVDCCALVTEPHGEAYYGQWAECTACGYRCALDEDPAHERPVEVEGVAEVGSEEICPF